MSFSIFMAPATGRSHLLTLRKLAKTYDAEYGSIIKIGGKPWVQLSDVSQPNYFSWAVKTFPYSSVLICCQLEKKFLVLAWENQAAICNQCIDYEQVAQLMKCLSESENFCPKVFYSTAQESLVHELEKHWQSVTEITKWPEIRPTIANLRPITFTFKTPVAVAIAVSVAIPLSLLVWPTANDQVIAQIPPEKNGIEELLTQAPGAVAPLLQLDMHLQKLLYQIPGWEVNLVEYQNGLLRYRMVRKTGHISELRKLANKLNISLLVLGEEVWLQRAVALPPVFTDPMALNDVSTLTHLEDHLDDNIRVFIPGSKTQFQGTANESDWRSRRAQIIFDGHFHEDLITLSAILNELPVRLVDVNYRIESNQLYGHVSIDIYGVNNG